MKELFNVMNSRRNQRGSYRYKGSQIMQQKGNSNQKPVPNKPANQRNATPTKAGSKSPKTTATNMGQNRVSSRTTRNTSGKLTAE